MKRSIRHSGLACLLGLLMISATYGQLRSPDPYQRARAFQQEQQDRQGIGQRGGQGQRQGQGGGRPDGMRGPQGGQQRGGPQVGRQGMEQRGPQGGRQRGPGGGQGGGASRNPVILALDTNRDGELSASEITNAAASLKSLDKNGDGNLSRDEMRPADSSGGPGGAERGRSPANQPRSPQGNSRPRMSRQGVPRTDANPPRRETPAPTDGFALIPAGQFEMGDHHDLGGREHRNDEVPIHPVSINAFYMQRTETTNRQYCKFLNDAWTAKTVEMRDGQVVQAGSDIIYCDAYESDEASQLALNSQNRFVVRPGKEMHPVVCIRWHGAAAYCNWLSEKENLAPCYDARTWACDFTKNGYRLPTEAEWEYAGRGGLTDTYHIFPWGDEPDTRRANWPNSGDPYETGPYPWTTPVAFYNGTTRTKNDFIWPGSQETYETADGANGYSLYDMSGNVWEWTGDWYHRDYYADGPTNNPTGPSAGTPVQDGNTYRVLRSGNWYNGQWGHGRVSNRNPSYYRGPDDPNHSYYHIGFRPVRPAEGRTAASNPPRNVAQPPRSRQPDTVLRPSLLESSGVDLGHGVPGDDEIRADGRTLGLLVNKTRAFDGYTLFAPKHNTMVYLIDNEGRVVNRWDTQYEPGQSVYLLENGHLLHCCFTKNGNFTRGGEGGRLEEYDWEGNLVWEFEYSTDKVLSHHDIAPLPNGNVLLLAVEYKSQEECIEAGFDPRVLRDGHLFPEHIIEVKKTGPKSGEIVWKWHVWDHMIQDFNPAKANYGNVSEHPERIDVHGSQRGIPAFWNHGNSIDYNADLDQIVLSARGFNEIWVIDHATTTEKAAGTDGDLLWRWGNPIAHQNGRIEDRKLFQQHDAQWIPGDFPGAGNMLIFNNGLDRGFTSVIEIKPPVNENGRYTSYEAPIVWEYRADPPEALYSSEISGAHRLPNGNTLICAGCVGNFIEVTPDGEIVWRYANSVVREGILSADGVPGTDHRGHQWNAVFKIHRYAPDYPGLTGKSLTPGDVIEQPIGAPMLATGDRSERKFGPDGAPGRGQRRGQRRGQSGGQLRPSGPGGAGCSPSE
jgi:formylglycine-generating enzyme required for sulfatase activity